MLFGFDPFALIGRLAGVRHRAAVDHIRHVLPALAGEPPARLRERAEALRAEACGVSGRPGFTADAVALIVEAVRRTRGLGAYDVQLSAGLALAEGRLVEMATGEGKTFVALLPAFAFALAGRGVHVATVNPYLAGRDCDFARAPFELLGLRAALLPEGAAAGAKRAAYAADVTYGVGTEFGFDYLRDQLALRAHAAAHRPPRFHDLLLGTVPPPPDLAQPRGHAHAVIDEADSVLIDEAASPLVISAGARRPAAAPEVYHEADAAAELLIARGKYLLDRTLGAVALTAAGRDAAFEMLPDVVLPHLRRQWPDYVETALRARLLLKRDAHYVVSEDRVMIVDEYTGRLCPDRTWRKGLHQAVEAVAGVPICEENASEATITRPAYFQLYGTLCGMTGTAREAAPELRADYGLRTVEVPSHRPSCRQVLSPRVFATRAAQIAAVATEVARRSRLEQPVLVGTRTIAMSDALAAALMADDIPFCLLNARQDAAEAEIVEQAGGPGVVTLATNMAGRGAHIPVPEESLRAGGLHVIAVEMNTSARVDRQLIGRTARQGQPGSAQFYLSLEDELLLRHAPAVAARLARGASGELTPTVARHFSRAQRRAEADARTARRALAARDRWLDELKHAL